MEWLFLLPIDFFEGGALAGDEMGRSLLTGAAGSGGVGVRRGLADVIMAKLDLLSYLMEWAKTVITSQDMTLLESLVVDVPTFRSKVGRVWSKKEKPPAMPWRANFSAAADKLLTLIENMCFGVEWDEFILTWLKSRKSIDDFFSREQTTQELEDIKEAAASVAQEEATAFAGKDVQDEDEDMEDAEEERFGIESDQVVKDALEEMDEGERQIYEKGKRFAQSLVATYVCLVAETEPDDVLSKHLAASAAGQVVVSNMFSQFVMSCPR